MAQRILLLNRRDTGLLMKRPIFTVSQVDEFINLYNSEYIRYSNVFFENNNERTEKLDTDILNMTHAVYRPGYPEFRANLKNMLRPCIKDYIYKKKYIPEFILNISTIADLDVLKDICIAGYSSLSDHILLTKLGVLQNRDFLINYKLQIYYNIVSYNSLFDIEMFNTIVTDIMTISQNPNYTVEIKLSYLDIIGINRYKVSTEIYNEYVRILERYRNIGNPNPGNIRNVYSDSQNVHDSDINSSARDSALKIIHNMPESFYENFQLNSFINRVKDYIKVNMHFNQGIDRIFKDTSAFTGKTLYYIMIAVVYEIENKVEYKDDAYKRLVEEIEDSHQYCATGYFVRLINSLSGYSEKVEIKINELQQLKTVLQTYINTQIQKSENMDDILHDMTIVKIPNVYTNFLLSIFTVEKFKEISKEYNVDTIFIVDTLITITKLPFTFNEKLTLNI